MAYAFACYVPSLWVFCDEDIESEETEIRKHSIQVSYPSLPNFDHYAQAWHARLWSLRREIQVLCSIFRLGNEKN